MAFRGFPDDAITTWSTHEATYDECVRALMPVLGRGLAALNGWSVTRVGSA